MSSRELDQAIREAKARAHEEAKLYEAIRKLYPHSRRYAPVGIVRNGSRKRVVECIWCGATESCCNDYPETERVRRFRQAHDSGCGRKILAESRLQGAER